MTRLHGLRARTVSYLPLSSKSHSTVHAQYMAAIQLPKQMQEAEQDYTCTTQYLLYSAT